MVGRDRIRTASRLVVKVGSSSLTTPQGMIDVQENLAVSNLADLDPSWLEYTMFATHPSAAQRIAMAEQWAAEHGVEVSP